MPVEREGDLQRRALRQGGAVAVAHDLGDLRIGEERDVETWPRPRRRWSNQRLVEIFCALMSGSLPRSVFVFRSGAAILRGLGFCACAYSSWRFTKSIIFCSLRPLGAMSSSIMVVRPSSRAAAEIVVGEIDRGHPDLAGRPTCRAVRHGRSSTGVCW